MTEVPEQHQPESSRPLNRMTTLGYRIDDDGPVTLLFVHEADGSWTIYVGGEIGIRLTSERMAVLAGEILRQAR